MKISLLGIVLGIILLFSLTTPLHAIQASRLAINDTEKKCQFFNPNDGDLPKNWRYSEYDKTIYPLGKETCNDLNYTFIEGTLAPNFFSSYKFYRTMISIVTFSPIIVCAILFIKTRRKSYIAATIIVLLLYFFLQEILNSFV